jgi:hypothetical protein
MILTRYRRTVERARRPLAAACFLLGLALLAQAIWFDRSATAYMTAVPILGGAVVSWLVPSGRRAHPPSESTLQWARKQRRERSPGGDPAGFADGALGSTSADRAGRGPGSVCEARARNRS